MSEQISLEESHNWRELVKRAIQDQIICVLNQPRRHGNDLQLQQMALGQLPNVNYLGTKERIRPTPSWGRSSPLDHVAHFRFLPLQGGRLGHPPGERYLPNLLVTNANSGIARCPA
jgi:hypothetical protein